MDSQVIRVSDMRNSNEKLVLSCIYNHDGISLSGIADLTGLPPPAVFRIFSSLLEKSLIHVDETPREYPDKKGRRPVYYRTRADALYVAGVDIRRDSAMFVLMDFRRNRVLVRSTFLSQGMPADELFFCVMELVRASLREYDVPKQRFLGLGLGCEGQVDPASGRILSCDDFPSLCEFDLRDRLSAALKMDVFVQAVSSVLALNMLRSGGAEGVDSLFNLVMGSGITGAVVNGAKTFRGRTISSLDFSHVSVNFDGEPCECGNRGCLRMYLSRPEGGDGALFLKMEVLSHLVKNLLRMFRPEAVSVLFPSEISAENHAAGIRQIVSSDPSLTRIQRIKVYEGAYDSLVTCQAAADFVMDDFFRS